MKNNTANFSARSGQKRPSDSPSTKGATTIKCGFCQNTFSAVPRNAVCLKCKRPANRPLSVTNKLVSFILFPIGLLKAVLMRSSQPYAASQALLFSIVGAALWGATYLLFLRG